MDFLFNIAFSKLTNVDIIFRAKFVKFDIQLAVII